MSLPFIRQGYHPNDDDYYLILDVDFNASQDEVSAAYKKLARKYHPDKNSQDERSQKEAQYIFQKIKTAYDVLGDPHKRKIYDTLGSEGLKLDGWKLVKKQITADEIRSEYLRLQKQQFDNQSAVIAKPKASFTIALDASEIFSEHQMDDEQGEDDLDDEVRTLEDTISQLLSVEVRSLSSSMSFENNLAPNHTMILNGNLVAKNGTGDGSFGTMYRYKYSPSTIIDLLLQAGRGLVLGTSVNHQFNQKTSVYCRGILVFNSYNIQPGTKITLAHKIRNYLVGKVSYKEGIDTSVTTSLIYMNEKLLFEVTTSYKLSHLHHGASVDIGYRFNNDKSRLCINLGASTNHGLAVEYGCETRVFEINVIGAALSFSLQAGVTLKIRYNRANQEFSVPIFLSDDINPGPVFYGTMVPLLAYYIIDRCYLKHYKTIR